jgi:hypothetical protein
MQVGRVRKILVLPWCLVQSLGLEKSHGLGLNKKILFQHVLIDTLWSQAFFFEHVHNDE